MQDSINRLVKACSYIERRAESAELEPWDFERHHAAEEEQHKWKWGEREDSNKYVKQHMFKFASESTRPVSTPEHIYFDSDVEDEATRLVVPLSLSRGSRGSRSSQSSRTDVNFAIAITW